jgi:hypothetical protein
MTRKTFIAVIGAVIASTGLGAFGLVSQSKQRPDCPGKIVCPINGELVCRDRCPAVDPSRPDCPGRIECPLTGELICRDRCPIGEQAAADTTMTLPSCCQNRN